MKGESKGGKRKEGTREGKKRRREELGMKNGRCSVASVGIRGVYAILPCRLVAFGFALSQDLSRVAIAITVAFYRLCTGS